MNSISQYTHGVLLVLIGRHKRPQVLRNASRSALRIALLNDNNPASIVRRLPGKPCRVCTLAHCQYSIIWCRLPPYPREVGLQTGDEFPASWTDAIAGLGDRLGLALTLHHQQGDNHA